MSEQALGYASISVEAGGLVLRDTQGNTTHIPALTLGDHMQITNPGGMPGITVTLYADTITADSPAPGIEVNISSYSARETLSYASSTRP